MGRGPPRARLGQAEIDELLVAYGRAGLEVVRLKGGDPFVFGRGGEEALALAAAGVPFTVTPGVSSVAAVPGGTIVVFMGLERLPELALGLVAAGLEPSTPAAAIAHGTLPGQETVSGRLDELAILAAGLSTPALVVIGEVVEVGRRLHAVRNGSAVAVGA